MKIHGISNIWNSRKRQNVHIVNIVHMHMQHATCWWPVVVVVVVVGFYFFLVLAEEQVMRSKEQNRTV